MALAARGCKFALLSNRSLSPGPLRREGHRLRRRHRPTRLQRGHPRQEHHARQQGRRPQVGIGILPVFRQKSTG